MNKVLVDLYIYIIWNYKYRFLSDLTWNYPYIRVDCNCKISNISYIIGYHHNRLMSKFMNSASQLWPFVTFLILLKQMCENCFAIECMYICFSLRLKGVPNMKTLPTEYRSFFVKFEILRRKQIFLSFLSHIAQCSD